MAASMCKPRVRTQDELSASHERQSAGLDTADEKVDTLLPGAIALRALLEGLGSSDALISTTGLREGLIADYAHARSS